jgi:hypothetical protein
MARESNFRQARGMRLHVVNAMMTETPALQCFLATRAYLRY